MKSAYPFDLSQVPYLSLHLDDDEQTRGRVEGKDVDPAAGSTLPDLDLSGRLPAGCLKALREIGGTPNMSRVALAFPIV
ncbi:MAG TPA: hypothetical protein VGQ64_11485 [Candidatus Limnocylindrales bacterium]|jgi:hypothetical protein|nr:hypothetical protein [Candidatus Limnocylindrales bacterium]